MAILAANLDYTDKDFDSIRARIFDLISGVFPRWTARQVANFGDILIESFAFMGDVLGKYQDNQAAESRWSVATQRKNLIALAKLIGFVPATATASQVDVTLSIPGVVAGDVDFAAGQIVRTRRVADPVVFRLLTDASITAGNTSVSVTAENAEPQEENFTSTGIPNLEIVLSHLPYLDDSAVVVAGNGTYSQVDNFLDSDSTERHFTVSIDQTDRARLRFGDGISGAIPTGTIVVLYKTGGGAAGVVEDGTVTAIDGSFADSFGTPVIVSVTNPAASTPAVNRQTNEQIRQLAPLSLRVQNRTVSREDYEINARGVPTVARALMLTSNEDASIQENQGFLFIIPTGGGVPTQALKDAVLNRVTVEFPNTLTFSLVVAQTPYLAVDVVAKVWLRKGAVASVVKASILSNLAAYFAVQNEDGTPNEEIGFGYDYLVSTGEVEAQLPLSDVFNVVRDTAGVRKIGDDPTDFTLNGAHSDVTLLLREFPILGDVTLINGETDTPL